MDAKTILRTLFCLGVQTRVVDGTVKFRPVSLVTPELKEAIRANKAAILEALGERPQISPDELELEIKEALAGIELPIPICSGNAVSDIDRYARIEARSALHVSPYVARAARERLWRLGISV